MTDIKLCAESVDGQHDWEKHALPPEQCEGKTHVCVRCGEEKTVAWEMSPCPKAPRSQEGPKHNWVDDLCTHCGAEKEIVVPNTMDLQTVDEAKDKGEHTEEFHEQQQKAFKELVTDDRLAKFIYEVKTAYMRMVGEEVQTTWDTVSEQAKTELNQEIHFVRNTLSAPPEQDKVYAMHIHDKLFAARLAAGYRFGPIVNHEDREHPDMVTYGMLPEKQKLKLFLARVLVRLTAGIQAGY